MKRANQAGVSLIGMLVGMLISLLSIAALLSLYRLEVDTSINAMGVARRDGQLASALLTAGQLLQQAGYGVEGATYASSTLSILEDGKKITWRFKPNLIVDTCTGLQVDNGLFLLPEKNPCSDASVATWTSRLPLVTSEAAVFVPQNRNGEPLTDEAGAVSLAEAKFIKHTGTCTLPYAQQSADTNEHPQISLVIPAAGGTSERVLFTVCLANIGT